MFITVIIASRANVDNRRLSCHLNTILYCIYSNFTQTVCFAFSDLCFISPSSPLNVRFIGCRLLWPHRVDTLFTVYCVMFGAVLCIVCIISIYAFKCIFNIRCVSIGSARLLICLSPSRAEPSRTLTSCLHVYSICQFPISSRCVVFLPVIHSFLNVDLHLMYNTYLCTNIMHT